MLTRSDIFDLSGKHVLVTGASSGLGSRFAKVLHDYGASVTLTARREDAMHDVVAQADLANSTVVSCDITMEDDRARLMQSAENAFGIVDVLINNAGKSNIAPAAEEELADFEEVISVNLTAAYALSQAVARRVISQGRPASIINIASMFALVGNGQIPQASYHASKGGLVALTRELAAQWARRSIRVNALAPGWFPTEMSAPLLDSDDGLAWVNRKTPLGRAGEPHELDGAIVFLASDASSYMTGQVLSVDGGWTAV